MSTEPHGRINPWYAFKHSGARRYLVASAVILVLSVALSLQTQSWSWVARSGGILVLFGVLLSLRKLFRLGPQKLDTPIEPLVINKNQFNINSMYQSINHLTDNFAQAFGVCLMVAGTILASYGDAVLDMLVPLK